MNNTGKYLLIGGASLIASGALFYVYKNIILAKEWDYRVEGFDVLSMKINTKDPKASGDLKLVFINKSSIKADLKDINIQVFSNGTRLGAIDEPGPLIIKGNGESPVKFGISFDAKALVKDWDKLLGTFLNTKDIPLDFVGTFRLRTLLGMYIKVPIKYSTTGKDMYKLYQQYYG